MSNVSHSRIGNRKNAKHRISLTRGFFFRTVRVSLEIALEIDLKWWKIQSERKIEKLTFLEGVIAIFLCASSFFQYEKKSAPPPFTRPRERIFSEDKFLPDLDVGMKEIFFLLSGGPVWDVECRRK